jgi:hypothetical protein
MFQQRATLAPIRLANAASQLPYGSGETRGEASTRRWHKNGGLGVGHQGDASVPTLLHTTPAPTRPCTLAQFVMGGRVFYWLYRIISEGNYPEEVGMSDTLGWWFHCL